MFVIIVRWYCSRLVFRFFLLLSSGITGMPACLSVCMYVCMYVYLSLLHASRLVVLNFN
jgi:hypothetical protein